MHLNIVFSPGPREIVRILPSEEKCLEIDTCFPEIRIQLSTIPLNWRQIVYLTQKLTPHRLFSPTSHPFHETQFMDDLWETSVVDNGESSTE